MTVTSFVTSAPGISSLADPIFLAAVQAHRKLAEASADLPGSIRSALLGPLRRVVDRISAAIGTLNRTRAFRHLDEAVSALYVCAGRVTIEGEPRMPTGVPGALLALLEQLAEQLKAMRAGFGRETSGDAMRVAGGSSARTLEAAVARPDSRVRTTVRPAPVERAALAKTVVARPRSARVEEKATRETQ